MPWFKTDDAFWRHRKVRKLGKDKLPAVGLWQLAGSWCADNIDENLSDGFVPREQVEAWDPRLRYARRLVNVGLWLEAEFDGEQGYTFHDWADFQKTRADVEAEREEWRQKKRKTRSRKVSPGDTPKDNGETPPENTTGNPQQMPPESPVEVPVPVPVPVPSSGSVGGESHVGQRARTRPPERCQRHIDQPAEGPCGKCGDARRAAEAWDAAQAARRQHITRDIEAARQDPRQRCDHGTDGGLFIHPTTGQSATCAFCRISTPEAS